jgi:rare lipoprotein A
MGLSVGGCAKQVRTYHPGDELSGHASWYGGKFHGRKTASGEVYNMNDFTAAHRTAPFGTRLKVTNIQTGQSTVVRVNDRGPFVRGRLIDLSYAAAKAIGLVQNGTALVQLKVLGRAQVSAPRAPESESPFYVQVGSFREGENARAMIRQLERAHPQFKAEVVQGSEMHRVWVGPFPAEEEARRAERELSDAGYDSLVLRR